MFRAKDLLVILVVTLSGLVVVGADKVPKEPNNALTLAQNNHREQAAIEAAKACRADINTLKIQIEGLKPGGVTPPEKKAELEAKEKKLVADEKSCQAKEIAVSYVCSDERTTLNEAMKALNTGCSNAGFGSNIKKCVERADLHAQQCLEGDLTAGSTSAQDAAGTRRIVEGYEGFRNGGRGSRSQCIYYGRAEYVKQKADFEKNQAQLESDIAKANTSLAERKKTLEDSISRIEERRAEAERSFRQKQDSGAQQAQADAMQLMNSIAKIEADKAKATVEMYEPKMKETQAVADERVALRPFADIRAICMAEYRKKLVSDGSLYSNMGGDKFVTMSTAKNAREQVYYDCVETHQTQVRAIKRSHQQARQGYRDQVRLIEQRIADLEKSKQMAQRQQAEAAQRVSASNADLGRILQEQMASMKADVERTRTAITQATEDNKKVTADMEVRRKKLESDIANLGGLPPGNKDLSEAITAIGNLRDLHNQMKVAENKDEPACKDVFRRLVAGANARNIPLTESNRSHASSGSELDRPTAINESEITGGGLDKQD